MINAEMECVCCSKNYLVTDIDFVNGELTIIIDDLRCTLDHISFNKVKYLKVNGIVVYMKGAKND